MGAGKCSEPWVHSQLVTDSLQSQVRQLVVIVVGSSENQNGRGLIFYLTWFWVSLIETHPKICQYQSDVMISQITELVWALLYLSFPSLASRPSLPARGAAKRKYSLSGEENQVEFLHPLWR